MAARAVVSPFEFRLRSWPATRRESVRLPTDVAPDRVRFRHVVLAVQAQLHIEDPVEGRDKDTITAHELGSGRRFADDEIVAPGTVFEVQRIPRHVARDNRIAAGKIVPRDWAATGRDREFLRDQLRTPVSAEEAREKEENRRKAADWFSVPDPRAAAAAAKASGGEAKAAAAAADDAVPVRVKEERVPDPDPPPAAITAPPLPPPADVPAGLRCGITGGLLREAVLAPCCGIPLSRRAASSAAADGRVVACPSESCRLDPTDAESVQEVFLLAQLIPAPKLQERCRAWLEEWRERGGGPPAADGDTAVPRCAADSTAEEQVEDGEPLPPPLPLASCTPDLRAWNELRKKKLAQKKKAQEEAERRKKEEQERREVEEKQEREAEAQRAVARKQAEAEERKRAAAEAEREKKRVEEKEKERQRKERKAAQEAAQKAQAAIEERRRQAEAKAAEEAHEEEKRHAAAQAKKRLLDIRQQAAAMGIIPAEQPDKNAVDRRRRRDRSPADAGADIFQALAGDEDPAAAAGRPRKLGKKKRRRETGAGGSPLQGDSTLSTRLSVAAEGLTAAGTSAPAGWAQAGDPLAAKPPLPPLPRPQRETPRLARAMDETVPLHVPWAKDWARKREEARKNKPVMAF